jgi:formylmethanofuran dehydrogenase subunit D
MTKLRHAKLEPGDKLKLISRDTEVVVQVVSIERKPEDDCVVFIRIERMEDEPSWSE